MKNRFLMGVIVVMMLLSPILTTQAVVEPCANPSWKGELFNNPTLSDTPLHTVCRRTIDFIWGGGVPYTGIQAGNFSTRWTTSQAFPSVGRYEFRAVFQGSMRVMVNDIPIIDEMSNSVTLQVVSQEIDITAAHTPIQMVVESFHTVAEARIKLDWFLVSGGSQGATDDHRISRNIDINAYSGGGGNIWSGVYFDNAALSGPPKNPSYAPADGLILNYNAILQNPATGSGDLQWSSRWTRTVDFPAGTYTFYLRIDDMGQVFLDGREIIRQNQPEGRVDPVTVEITAGRHEIRVEHIKLNQTGGVFLTWEPPIGTMLLPNGCNAVEVAGIFGNAELCSDSPIAALSAATSPPTSVNSAPANFVSLPLTVTVGSLNFRPEPSTNNQPISRLQRGQSYIAIGRTTDNIWVQVEVDELVGWVQTQYIRLDGDINTLPISTGGQLPFASNTNVQSNSVVTTNPSTSVVIPDSNVPSPTDLQAISQRDLTLYSAASDQSAILGVIPVGLPVSLVGKTSDSIWVLVVLPTGLQGWSLLDGYDILPDIIPIIG